MKRNVLKEIEKEMSDLNTDELLKLMELLIDKVKKHRSLAKDRVDWKEIYGKGKGLWKEDAQKFVASIRREERI